jgi:16S rRNA (cytosine1402-N4)-methyltransferase
MMPVSALAFNDAVLAEPHLSVMRDEAVAALDPRDGGVYIDGTFGAGGYSRAILEAAGCGVIGLDRDPTALEAGAELVDEFGGRLKLVQSRFGDMVAALEQAGVDQVDGIVLDIGVSSMQLDQAERGFSFRFEGPLDMRMGSSGVTAADLVNHLEEKDLSALLRALGEERRAGAIARAIVNERQKAPLTTTLQLANLVESVLGRRPNDPIHPATRTFQGLRLAVNDELGELARALFAAEKLLKPGGRLVVVSFHSLEDRIVKTFLTDRSRTSAGTSRYLPAQNVPEPTFTQVTRGIVTPSAHEVAFNPRARSARMRVAERSIQPPREDSDALAYGVPRLPALAGIFGQIRS